MEYFLKREEKDLLIFFISAKDIVTSCKIVKRNTELLPLPLKRLVKDGYKEEFVSNETDNFYVANEDGCELITQWLSDRAIPTNRDYFDSYVPQNKTAIAWMLESNGYSYNDCYWFESENQNLEWKNILAKMKNIPPLNNVKYDCLYANQNCTLGGQLEKFWYARNGQICLCKKHNAHFDILSAREVAASLIYKQQSYGNYCHYDFLYSYKDENIVGCACQIFTNPNMELVSAYDLLSEYNMTQVDDVWEKIAELAEKYGLSKQVTSDYMDMQTMVDFLISNRDRHERNIAFLRDAETLQIISPAPIFDNGSSAHYEGVKPEGLYNTTVNGLYRTEMECLQHVSNFSLLDIKLLPPREAIEGLYNKCENLSQSRKEFLLDMYESKKELLAELQMQYQLGTNMAEYIAELVREDQERNQNRDIFDTFFE